MPVRLQHFRFGFRRVRRQIGFGEFPFVFRRRFCWSHLHDVQGRIVRRCFTDFVALMSIENAFQQWLEDDRLTLDMYFILYIGSLLFAEKT